MRTFITQGGEGQGNTSTRIARDENVYYPKSTQSLPKGAKAKGVQVKRVKLRKAKAEAEKRGLVARFPVPPPVRR